MINLFVTYRCNLCCPYCFAADMQKEYGSDMSNEQFSKLLDWMEKSDITSAAFIGGEPTLHHELPTMIGQTAQKGISVTLFTNGLFDEELIGEIAPMVSNFVVNYNDPEIFTTSEQLNQFHTNLGVLRDRGCRITLSKNFSPSFCEFEYLLEGASRYKVEAIRYDISRPGSSCANDYFGLHQMSDISSKVVDFVRGCDQMGIKTGMDCCATFCDFSAADVAYLQRHSMKFTGICHPSVDIHPDLSASYCLPMHDVKVDDITSFPRYERVLHYFANAVRPQRFQDVSPECQECTKFKRVCQGGCMAAKRLGPKYPIDLIGVQSITEVAHG